MPAPYKTTLLRRTTDTHRSSPPPLPPPPRRHPDLKTPCAPRRRPQAENRYLSPWGYLPSHLHGVAFRLSRAQLIADSAASCASGDVLCDFSCVLSTIKVGSGLLCLHPFQRVLFPPGSASVTLFPFAPNQPPSGHHRTRLMPGRRPYPTVDPSLPQPHGGGPKEIWEHSRNGQSQEAQ